MGWGLVIIYEPELRKIVLELCNIVQELKLVF